MAHSAIVGGSTAGRLLECPASYHATYALPASANVESVYAAEGSAMHEVMEQLMRLRRQDPGADLYSMAEQMLDQLFYGIALRREHLDDMIFPALHALADLENAYGGLFEVVGIEEQVQFPGIPGAFGTIDLLLSDVNSERPYPSTVLHVDWKFGSGVGVKAVYKDEHGEKVNPQLLYYATASKHSLRRLYPKYTNLVLAIIQPRAEPALSHVAISHTELKWFKQDLEKAVVRALDRDPPRIRGEHCRFAPCKSTCPKWTGAVLDLSVIGVPKPVTADHAEAAAYGAFLAQAKVLVDMAVQYKTEIDGQIHAFLESGGSVPGWRLKYKTKQRKWVDNATVIKALKKLGFKKDDIVTEELVSFKSADTTAKRLGVEIPDDLRVAPPSTETTIATTDDPAPVVDRAKTVELFKASLKQLGM